MFKVGQVWKDRKDREWEIVEPGFRNHIRPYGVGTHVAVSTKTKNDTMPNWLNVVESNKKYPEYELVVLIKDVEAEKVSDTKNYYKIAVEIIAKMNITFTSPAYLARVNEIVEILEASNA